MNISSVYPNSPSGNSAPQQGAGVDSKIQSLEQKLQKLETEKQKAAQRKDEEQKEKLEKQIKEIEKQIQQLRKQENEKAQKTESSDIQKAQESSPKAIDAGKYIDVYA